MKKLLTLFLLLSALSGVCQTNTQKEKGWKIELVFSPDYYLNKDRNIIETGDYSVYVRDRAEFNFTAGLVGRFPLMSKLEAGVGLLYSRKDFKGTAYCEGCYYLVPLAPRPFQFRFIEVPLSIRYKFIDQKVDLFLEPGLTGSYLIESFPAQQEEKFLSSKKIVLSGQLGVGASLDLSHKLSLSFTTAYKRAITSFSTENHINLQAFSFITGVGFRI